MSSFARLFFRLGPLCLTLIFVVAGVIFGVSSHQVSYQKADHITISHYLSDPNSSEAYIETGDGSLYVLTKSSFTPAIASNSLQSRTATILYEAPDTHDVDVKATNTNTHLQGKAASIVQLISYGSGDISETFTAQEYTLHPQGFYRNNWLVGGGLILAGLVLGGLLLLFAGNARKKALNTPKADKPSSGKNAAWVPNNQEMAPPQAQYPQQPEYAFQQPAQPFPPAYSTQDAYLPQQPGIFAPQQDQYTQQQQSVYPQQPGIFAPQQDQYAQQPTYAQQQDQYAQQQQQQQSSYPQRQSGIFAPQQGLFATPQPAPSQSGLLSGAFGPRLSLPGLPAVARQEPAPTPPVSQSGQPFFQGSSSPAAFTPPVSQSGQVAPAYQQGPAPSTPFAQPAPTPAYQEPVVPPVSQPQPVARSGLLKRYGSLPGTPAPQPSWNSTGGEQAQPENVLPPAPYQQQ